MAAASARPIMLFGRGNTLTCEFGWFPSVMLHGELPQRSHLVQPQQILLFGNARWTAFACIVVIGPYLHISFQESNSCPYLDNGLGVKTVRLTVLE